MARDGPRSPIARILPAAGGFNVLAEFRLYRTNSTFDNWDERTLLSARAHPGYYAAVGFRLPYRAVHPLRPERLVVATARDGYEEVVGNVAVSRAFRDQPGMAPRA